MIWRTTALSQISVFLFIAGLSCGLWQSWLYAVASFTLVLSGQIYRAYGGAGDKG